MVSLLILVFARSVLPRRPGARRWEPRVLVVVLAAMIPVLMAARVMPTGSEYADRLFTFLFLALSLLVARSTDRWSQLRRGSNLPSWSHRHRVIVQFASVGARHGRVCRRLPDGQRTRLDPIARPLPRRR